MTKVDGIWKDGDLQSEIGRTALKLSDVLQLWMTAEYEVWPRGPTEQVVMLWELSKEKRSRDVKKKLLKGLSSESLRPGELYYRKQDYEAGSP